MTSPLATDYSWDIFKENILDIIDNWYGYPYQDPCGPGIWPPFIGEGASINAAVNAGVVNFRCFINNFCPFLASPKKEDALIFNHDTMQNNVNYYLPEKSKLLTHKNVEGAYFQPRYVFRHNYIYIKKPDSSSGNWDNDHEEIDYNQHYKYIKGADYTRYKPELSWEVTPSVFDEITDTTTTTTEECKRSCWRYMGVNPEGRDSSNDLDLQADYTTSCYSQYSEASEEQKAQIIDASNVQTPVQENVLSDDRAVHWRVLKRTPIFRGEDFFIRFYKMARSKTMKVKKSASKGEEDAKKKFKNIEGRDDYSILDVRNNDSFLISGKTFIGRKYINEAVHPFETGYSKAKTTFDLFDQAYYIVELGYGNNDENYFILITEQNPPIFIKKQAIGKKYYSSLISAYEKMQNCSQLIEAKYFTMTVRSHLGKIMIIFDGPNFSNIEEPWIINGFEVVARDDYMGGHLTYDQKSRVITIPRGRMSIWGGNLRAGFLFGPLQYQQSHTSILYPPRKLDIDEVEGVGFRHEKAFLDTSAISLAASEDGVKTFQTNPFFLPYSGRHHIKLSSANIFLEDFEKDVLPVGKALTRLDLFMQDAQFYRDYSDTGRGAGRQKKNWEYGGFFYGEALKEFSDPGTAKCKTSNMTVRKYDYLDDKTSRHQAFDVLIGLMTGDHLFTSAFWDMDPKEVIARKGMTSVSNKTRKPTNVFVSFEPNGLDAYKDGEWFLSDCKTPILTMMRLIAEESYDTRWPDGTSVNRGQAFTPYESMSPYFLDATQHVMSFSDSWSTNGFSEMEHTGTIQFFLQPEDIINYDTLRNYNVTEYLLALQNKTFFIEIWAGYNNCSGTRQQGLYKLFTGMCRGGTIDYQYGKNIMSCKIEDYTAVLKGSIFFNSPWYDGLRDINAIDEILKMCGFRSKGKYDPASLVSYLANPANTYNGVFFHHFDGRLFKFEPFGLPSGYSRLEQPGFKFNDGDTYYDAIAKITKVSAKTFFFDEFGIAHYEDFQDIVEKDYLGKIKMVPLYQFTSNPNLWGGQMLFNKIERKYDVEGMQNHIKILSNTPDMHLIIGDALNWNSLENPNSEGFIGFLKTYYVKQGLFGSLEALNNAIQKYKVMFRPIINIKFETYGVPLRTNDIVSVNGEVVRVIKVSHAIDAKKNEWWMEVETMKYQTINSPTLLLEEP